MNFNQDKKRNIILDALKEEYKSLFTTRNETNHQHDDSIIENFPSGKCAGFNDVRYEMIKYSKGDNLIDLLKLIFEKMINYQIVPFNFNISVNKSIIKDAKKSKSDINNLRPVSISDAFSNIYEAILLTDLEKQHIDNHKQFGFKSKSSCSHAIFSLKQSIAKSIWEKKRLYVAAIDASKAFDKVGVKQGGVISPKLFSIYIEDLITGIEKFEHGVKFGSVKVDIVAYAVDILLLSQTRAGLRDQLSFVADFGEKNEIKFNPQKSVYMILGISNKCKTTDPFNALKLETTRERMNKIKVDFYFRLYENDFTKNLLEYMELTENPNDFINEIYEKIGILTMEIDLTTYEACNIYRRHNTGFKDKLKENKNQNVLLLRKAFGIKEVILRIKKITELIKYDAEPTIS
ncbi:unnamed protein product [Brachionus calyciflorus]|uniref:Reverse transcriptase domain-containing protein n=1 Tax=Brachionus calyciflorus TaxID=104777 RepID=A0A813TJM0_9BILA|nr:unnamed protein product [Brachionus calyciflorus]